MSGVFYLCDGERENCKKRTCYKNGGNCRHTTNINHAMNFERRAESENASFFEKEEMQDKEVYTKQEVIELLQEMQQESLKTKGLIVGTLTTLWVVRDLIGKRIKEMGGTEVPYEVQ